MRPCHNPYGGVNPLIDKMIGNAYDIVKYVASYLKEIRYLAENMSTVYDVAHGYRIQLNGNPDGSSELFLDLPSTLDHSAITSLDVLAIYNDNFYVASPDTFNFGIMNGQVVISINTGSLPELADADYRVTIGTLPASYTPPET